MQSSRSTRAGRRSGKTGPRIDSGLVDAALSLTRTKHQGAAVMAGHRVREIATLTGRTEGTVRWHLNKVFPQSRGISGQADLARRVCRWKGFRGIGRDVMRGRPLPPCDLLPDVHHVDRLPIPNWPGKVHPQRHRPNLRVPGTWQNPTGFIGMRESQLLTEIPLFGER